MIRRNCKLTVLAASAGIFAYFSSVLSDVTRLFADVASIFAYFAGILANIAGVFADVTSVFSHLTGETPLELSSLLLCSAKERLCGQNSNSNQQSSGLLEQASKSAGCTQVVLCLINRYSGCFARCVDGPDARSLLRVSLSFICHISPVSKVDVCRLQAYSPTSPARSSCQLAVVYCYTAAFGSHLSFANLFLCLTSTAAWMHHLL